VSRQVSARDVLQMIVRSARTLAGARYAALGVPDDRGSFAEFVVDGVSARQQRAIGPLPRQHGMLGVLLREGRPLRLAAIRADPRFEGWPAAHPELSDVLGVPIRDGSQVLGFIFAASKATAGGFTERDERLLGLFAAHAAIALTNARLYERGRELSVLEERARLARDLHDAVSQKLFSVRARASSPSVGPHPVGCDEGPGFVQFDPSDYLHRTGSRRTPDQVEALFADLCEGHERKRALTLSVLEEGDWDLFAAVFSEGHCTGHQLWHVHDEGHETDWGEHIPDDVYRSAPAERSR